MLRTAVVTSGSSNGDVVDEDGLPVVHACLHRCAGTDLGLVPVVAGADQDEFVPVPVHDTGHVGIAQLRGLRHDALEDGIEIAGVVADQLQDLRRRRLQLQRLGQFGVALFDLAEQTGVVDRDGGLVGERLQEGDLVVGVPAGFRAGEPDRADGDSAAHHRHGERALVAHRSRRGRRERGCVLAVPVANVDDLAA